MAEWDDESLFLLLLQKKNEALTHLGPTHAHSTKPATVHRCITFFAIVIQQQQQRKNAHVTVIIIIIIPCVLLLFTLLLFKYCTAVCCMYKRRRRRDDDDGREIIRIKISEYFGGLAPGRQLVALQVYIYANEQEPITAET